MTGSAARRRHPYLRDALPLALAHRGDRRRHPPGNTWPAFESAVALGFRYLETDVQVSRDGVLVLFHDDRLDEATTGHGPISQLRWDELRTLRYRAAGRATDDGLVRLDELLDRWPAVRLNLDAKTGPTVAPLVRLLEQERALDRTCLASFDRHRITRLRRQARGRTCTILSRPEVALLRAVSLVPVVPAWLLERMIGGDAAQVPVRYQHVSLADGRFVDAAHRLGIDVHVWTVDRPDEAHRLLDLGVDGLITNDPAGLKRVLVERGQWDG